MSKDHIDVNYVANLARLNLSQEEVTTFQRQIEDILGYINKLEELEIDGIEPTAHAAPVYDRIREDLVKPSLDREVFLNIAPDTINDQLKVPKVIEEL
jgi:aspartyl-tRNA(Asn)/glutamyl-tRNA(Gln) amidotransferase subunit C